MTPYFDLVSWWRQWVTCFPFFQREWSSRSFAFLKPWLVSLHRFMLHAQPALFHIETVDFIMAFDVADVALSIKDKCATTRSKEYTQNTKQHRERKRKATVWKRLRFCNGVKCFLLKHQKIISCFLFATAPAAYGILKTTSFILRSSPSCWQISTELLRLGVVAHVKTPKDPVFPSR